MLSMRQGGLGRAAVVVSLSVLLGGCSTTVYKLSAPSAQAAQVRFEQGAVVLTSAKTQSGVTVRALPPLTDYEELLRLEVRVDSRSESELLADIESVRAEANGSPVPVVTFEQLAGRTSMTQFRAMAASAHAAYVDGSGPSKGTFNATANTTLTGNRSATTSVSGTYTDARTAEVHRQVEIQKSQALAVELNAAAAATKQLLAQRTFRQQTVRPGGSYEGLVFLRRPPDKRIEYRIEVSFGSDLHQFSLVETTD